MLTPLTFMQRTTSRIRRKKPSTVGTIEDEMTRGLAHDSSTGSLEVLCKGGIDWELKMREGKPYRVGGHLLADLPAPHDNEFGAGQFFQPHGTPGMDA